MEILLFDKIFFGGGEGGGTHCPTYSYVNFSMLFVGSCLSAGLNPKCLSRGCSNDIS